MDSGYLLVLDVCPTRSGAEWAEVLGAQQEDQGLSPSVVVKDAGSGLAAGVGEAWPKAEQRDDLFHVLYLIGKEAAHLERRAYGAIGAVEVIVARRRRARSPTQLRSLGKELGIAEETMARSIDRYDRFEALRRETRRMLTLTERGSGQLRTSSEVTVALIRIADEMPSLGGPRILKIAGYVRNRAAGLGLYLDALQRRLDEATEAAGGHAPTAAATRAYQASLDVYQVPARKPPAFTSPPLSRPSKRTRVTTDRSTWVATPHSCAIRSEAGVWLGGCERAPPYCQAEVNLPIRSRLNATTPACT